MRITTELAGFNPGNAKVTVSVGGAFNVPIKMDVAGTKENVNVVAEVPRINTTNGEVSTTITETQIRELPTITRNVYDLVAVAGNVSGGKVADGEEWTATTRGTGYNINGQRASSTNILLDGSANNNEFDDGRPERPARFGAGIQRRHQQLLGAVRPRHRRRGQRADQVGDEQLPRHRLRVLSQRRAVDQHVRQQGQRDREGRVHPPSDGLQHRRADPRDKALSSRTSNTSASAARTRSSAGSRRRSSSRRARRRPGPSSRPTAAA